MIIFAVGDIQRCSGKLEKLLLQIETHAACHDGPTCIVDLRNDVGRGPDSAGVIARLMSGLPTGIDEQVCLHGNHEPATRVELGLSWGSGHHRQSPDFVHLQVHRGEER